jgi:tetratricopeptide (TPR) repeat protein
MQHGGFGGMSIPFQACLSAWLSLLAGLAAGQVQPKAGLEAEGMRLFGQGQYQKASPLLEAASAASPERPELARASGLCYLRLSNSGGARLAFARLFGVPPDSAKARLLAAKMMMGERMEGLAEPELRAAVKLDPRLPEVHFILGEIAIYHGDADTGIAEMQQEIALNPAFSMAYYRLGDAFTRKDMWDQAVGPLQKAIWLNPDFSSPYILLGKAYYRMDRLEFAEGMLKQAVRMDPNNAGAHYLLSNVYRDMGRQEDFRKELELWRKAKE